jgi:DNA repair photolyase
MNGKPVHTVPARTIINFKSAFEHKLLCDGMTFSAGSACVYKCCFCYVPDMAQKFPGLGVRGARHEDVVIRRESAVEIATRQLLDAKGRPKFMPRVSPRMAGENGGHIPAVEHDGTGQGSLAREGLVIYASPLVDVAGNMELARETVEICKRILVLTRWHIRLLSKSNLLPVIARALDEAPELNAKARVIYGVSTGTLDDSLARSFEGGTPLVSKRLDSLHWLQDHGYRTFGMICPSLPQFDYPAFAQAMRAAIRAEHCEHVWAEVINLRGESFTRTYRALAATHPREAELLRVVMNDKPTWESYARATFEAHAALYGLAADGTPKLRFLQYVTGDTVNWWQANTPRGAIIL